MTVWIPLSKIDVAYDYNYCAVTDLNPSSFWNCSPSRKDLRCLNRRKSLNAISSLKGSIQKLPIVNSVTSFAIMPIFMSLIEFLRPPSDHGIGPSVGSIHFPNLSVFRIDKSN
ncbi:hypothetical protein TNIN_281961 [Trichonephila inaurata madagascariensis]|uniref:Uncharacterized protein n=1 Tax=Trichonephila inaurata madagascariensis TaxID=2747483 RepID=A0A8X7CMP9_9ARAC|nr:hypothetical protein TNIN_281961 [Trichonephila inaurata madagascariensis]